MRNFTICSLLFILSTIKSKMLRCVGRISHMEGISKFILYLGQNMSTLREETPCEVA
jgi:hypothetical protein